MRKQFKTSVESKEQMKKASKFSEMILQTRSSISILEYRLPFKKQTSFNLVEVESSKEKSKSLSNGNSSKHFKIYLSLTRLRSETTNS